MGELQPITTQKGVLQRIEDNPINFEVLSIAAKKADFQENYLKSIIKNKNRIIRKLPKSEVIDLYLLNEIKKIAAAYGSAIEVSTLVQRECVKALHNEFKSLSIAEVWLAFRLHAAGELPDPKGRGELYRGKLTAKAFSAVLSAWKGYKAKAVAEYIKTSEAEKEAENEAKRAERMKGQMFPSIVESLKRIREDSKNWESCPTHIFDILRKRGLIEGLENPEIWKPIWEDAKVLARMDYQNEKSESIAKRGQIRLVGSVAKSQMAEKVEVKTKTIAKKLALYRLVILNNSFNLDSLLGLQAD